MDNKLGQPSSVQAYDPLQTSFHDMPSLGVAMVSAIKDLRPETYHLYDSISSSASKEMPSEKLFDLAMKGIGPTMLIDMHQQQTAKSILGPYGMADKPTDYTSLAPDPSLPPLQQQEQAPVQAPIMSDAEIEHIASKMGYDKVKLDLTEWNRIKSQIAQLSANRASVPQPTPLQKPSPLQLALGALGSLMAPSQGANIMSMVFGYNVQQKQQEDERRFRDWQIQNQMETDQLKYLAALGDDEMKAAIAKYEQEGRAVTEEIKAKLVKEKQDRIVKDSINRQLKAAPNLASVIGSIEDAYHSGYIDENDARQKVIGKAQQDWSDLTTTFVKKLGFVPETVRDELEQHAQKLLSLAGSWGLKREDLINPSYEEDYVAQLRKAKYDNMVLKNEWYPKLSDDVLKTNLAKRDLWAQMIESKIISGNISLDNLNLAENKFLLDQWESANRVLSGGKAIDTVKLQGALNGAIENLKMAKARKYVPGTATLTKEFQSKLPSEQKKINEKIMEAEKAFAIAKGNMDAALEELKKRVNPAQRLMPQGMPDPTTQFVLIQQSPYDAYNPIAGGNTIVPSGTASGPIKSSGSFKLGKATVSWKKDKNGNIVRTK